MQESVSDSPRESFTRLVEQVRERPVECAGLKPVCEDPKDDRGRALSCWFSEAVLLLIHQSVVIRRAQQVAASPHPHLDLFRGGGVSFLSFFSL